MVLQQSVCVIGHSRLLKVQNVGSTAKSHLCNVFEAHIRHAVLLRQHIQAQAECDLHMVTGAD